MNKRQKHQLIKSLLLGALTCGALGYAAKKTIDNNKEYKGKQPTTYEEYYIDVMSEKNYTEMVQGLQESAQKTLKP